MVLGAEALVKWIALGSYESKPSSPDYTIFPSSRLLQMLLLPVTQGTTRRHRTLAKVVKSAILPRY
jgi:hypothetical protein